MYYDLIRNNYSMLAILDDSLEQDTRQNTVKMQVGIVYEELETQMTTKRVIPQWMWCNKLSPNSKLFF